MSNVFVSERRGRFGYRDMNIPRRKKPMCRWRQRTEVMGYKVKGRQGVPATTTCEEGARKDSPQSLPRSTAWWHFKFGRPASRTVREYTSVDLSHPACDTFLWRLQETNTADNEGLADTRALFSDRRSQVGARDTPSCAKGWCAHR